MEKKLFTETKIKISNFCQDSWKFQPIKIPMKLKKNTKTQLKLFIFRNSAISSIHIRSDRQFILDSVIYVFSLDSY